MAAMHLHGRLGNAQIASDLLAKPALVDLNHDLALAWSQRCETILDRSHGFFTLTPGAIARETDLDGIKEILIAIRLREELNSAPLHRLHRHRDIAMPGDKDDWEFFLRRRELALKVETASPRQSHVEHQAAGPVRRGGLQKVGDGCKQLSLQAERPQQPPNRGPNVRIVVDDENSGVGVRHYFCSQQNRREWPALIVGTL